MKTIKIFGIVIVVLVVLFFGIAAFLPSEVQVERSLVIPASSQIIFNQINDLRQWEEWSPWHRKDPNMKITYEGFLSGKGASYHWESKEMGNGNLTITESRPFQYIAIEMDFLEEGTANGYYKFKPVEDGTEVTWGFETDLGEGPIAKYRGLMMDNMVGSDFEKGLHNLKVHIETFPENALSKEASTGK